jgi:predicted nucleic acid-binding protein
MIFVDTSFWTAAQIPRDRRHGDAVALLRRIGDEQLVTSNHVRGETWTFLRRRAGHKAAVAFLSVLARTRRLTVYLVSPTAEDHALVWLRRHDERAYSFVDATSFAVMRELRIDRALAFDDDFAAAGFQELRP